MNIIDTYLLTLKLTLIGGFFLGLAVGYGTVVAFYVIRVVFYGK